MERLIDAIIWWNILTLPALVVWGVAELLKWIWYGRS